MIDAMLGKWIIINDDEMEYYNIGQVTDIIGDDLVLIRLQPVKGPVYSRIYHLCELHQSQVFDSEEEMNAWHDWATRDDSPKVVQMKRGDKK